MNGSEQTSLLGRVSQSRPRFFAVEAAAEPGPGSGSLLGLQELAGTVGAPAACGCDGNADVPVG